MKTIQKATSAAKVAGMGLAVAAVFAIQGVAAQAPANPPAQTPPASQQNAPKTAPKESNPFPTDTSNIPLVPSTDTPPVPDAGGDAPPAMPAADADPAKSPDDPSADNSSSGDSSSSLAGLARVLDAPDPDTKSRRNGKNQEPEHQETAKEDESVGAYYLSSHDWKAALSRFESAVVLDPDNPDVYWGLAEAQRHLGDYASARANYQKLLNYDPDNKHARDAKKALKEPEVANARADTPKPAAKP